jgi:hypothetical protein
MTSVPPLRAGGDYLVDLVEERLTHPDVGVGVVVALGAAAEVAGSMQAHRRQVAGAAVGQELGEGVADRPVLLPTTTNGRSTAWFGDPAVTSPR